MSFSFLIPSFIPLLLVKFIEHSQNYYLKLDVSTTSLQHDNSSHHPDQWLLTTRKFTGPDIHLWLTCFSSACLTASTTWHCGWCLTGYNSTMLRLRFCGAHLHVANNRFQPVGVSYRYRSWPWSLFRCWRVHCYSNGESMLCSTPTDTQRPAFTVTWSFTDSDSRALIVSKLDYSCSVLAGVSGTLQRRLQSVFNAAARLVFSARKSEHVTPLLQELHWLKVPERI